MPGIEPGASHMRSERSTTELHPHWLCEYCVLYKYQAMYILSGNVEPFLFYPMLVYQYERKCSLFNCLCVFNLPLDSTVLLIFSEVFLYSVEGTFKQTKNLQYRSRPLATRRSIYQKTFITCFWSWWLWGATVAEICGTMNLRDLGPHQLRWLR